MIVAEYRDPAGRDFVFVRTGRMHVHCYERKGGGGMIRCSNWDLFAPQTKQMLLRIGAWIHLDLPVARIDPTEVGFRFYDKGGCGDCSEVYAT